MADYYPLLAKALAGLPNNSSQNSRQAIYDRARKALIGQLRSMRPPLAEEDIAREDAALDAAISRLESERFAAAPGQGADGAAPSSPPAPSEAPAKPAATPHSAGPQPAASAAPSRPSPAAPTPTKSPGAAAQQAAPPRSAGAPPPAKAATASGAPRYAPPSRPPSSPGAPPLAQRPPIIPPLATPTAPSVEAEAQSSALERPTPPPVLGPAVADEGDAPAVAVSAPKANGETGRPAAPGPAQPRRRSIWPRMALLVLVVAIAAVAGFAVIWKEKPQDLAIKDGASAAAKANAPQNKIVDRVQANATGEATAPAAAASPTPADTPAAATAPASSLAAPAPAVATTAPAANPPPTSPPPAGEAPIATVTVPTVPVHPTEAAPGAQTATVQPPAAQGPQPARAALLIDAGDPQKPKIDLGTAVWTLLPPGAGPAQAAGPSVQADVDIPELKMHATVTIRKNTDASLPATHTMDLRFSFADGADAKGFKDMALPQLRRDDTPNGEAVSGVRVKISDSYFLVGLTRSDTDLAHNLDLLSSRNWLDFPLLFNDDHVAKLTFEKGPTGQAVIAQAVAAWK